jgi:hypothetical protein
MIFRINMVIKIKTVVIAGLPRNPIARGFNLLTSGVAAINQQA